MKVLSVDAFPREALFTPNKINRSRANVEMTANVKVIFRTTARKATRCIPLDVAFPRLPNRAMAIRPKYINTPEYNRFWTMSQTMNTCHEKRGMRNEE